MKKLLKPEQVAEALGIQISTIYQWAHMKKIPYVKVGRFVRFREEDIEKWMNKNSVKVFNFKKIL